MKLSSRRPQFSLLKIRHYAIIYYTTIPQKYYSLPVILRTILEIPEYPQDFLY